MNLTHAVSATVIALAISTGCANTRTERAIEFDTPGFQCAPNTEIPREWMLRHSVARPKSGSESAQPFDTDDERIAKNDVAGAEPTPEVEHAPTFAPFSASFGLMHHWLPATNAADPTRTHGQLPVDELFFTPTWATYYDAARSESAYCAVGLAREFDVCEALTFATDVTLGWMSRGLGKYVFGVREQGFSDLTLSARLSYALSERTHVMLGLSLAQVLDRNYRDSAESENPVWAVIGFETGF